MSPVVDRIKPWRISERVGWLDDVAWIVAGLAAVGAVAAERDRRRAVLRLGVGVGAVGVGIVAVTTVIPRVVAHEARASTSGRPSSAASSASSATCWRSGCGSCRSAWSSPQRRPRPAHRTSSATAAAPSPRRRPGSVPPAAGVRAVAGVGFVLVAYALVRYRDGIVPALLTIAGALVGYVGVVTFLDAALGARVDATAEREKRARRRHRRMERLRTAGVGLVVAALVVGAVVAAGVAVARARIAPEPTPSCVATASPRCAIAASTRWRSPARTTRCRRRTTPAGSSPRT